MAFESSVPQRLLFDVHVDAIADFVLSLVDGHTSVETIANETGLSLGDVYEILTQLAQRNIISLPGYDGTSKNPAPVSGARPTDDSEADLDPAMKEKVRIAFENLALQNHYEILGLPTNADRKAIKSAFYDFATLFHPDRYFGRRLGTFKAKMEAIFGKMSEAHDVLSHPKLREQYDEEMGIERLPQVALAESPTTPTKSISGEFAAIQSSGPPEVHTPASANKMAAAPPIVSEVRSSSRPPPPLNNVSPEELERIRRQNLARRLSGTPRSSSQPNFKVQTAQILTPESAVESIKNRYLEKQNSERPAGRVSDTVARAEALASQGDFEGAASTYKLAHSLSNDPIHELKSDQMLTQFYAKSWESWLEKGSQAYAAGHFLEAANHLAKAHRGHPDDPEICIRLAHALKKGGETRRASAMADRAVTLAPESLVYRELLAALLLDSGLFLRAKREAETVLSKAPESETARSILSRAKKMAGTSS